MPDNINIIILFLAHKGVMQPEWWNKWKNASEEYKNNIIFRVHAPLNPEHGEKFCNDNTIGFYDEQTKWCRPSLVKVYFSCLKSIMIEFPANSLIYLVSGYDIPIRPSRYMFQDKYEIYNTETKIFDPKTYNHKLSRICKVNDTQSHQWLALSSDDANKIYYNYENNFQKYIDMWYIDRKGCPDETFITNIINIINLKYDVKCTTIDYRSNCNDPSPIEWNDLDEEKYIYILNKKKCIKSTLRKIIYHENMTSHNFFYEKNKP